MTEFIDDEDERTRVSHVATPGVGDDDEDERTRVNVATPAVGDDDDDERTRVNVATPAVGDDDDDERTRVNAAKPRTPAQAGDDDDEHTNIATREDADGRTVVSRKPTSSPVLNPSQGGRRRGIAEPPVPRGFAPRAVKASGAGAVAEYVPRAITPPPALPQLPTLAPDATRVPSPQLPSVRQRAHRNARRAMIMFVVACVLAVAGATAIVLAIIEL